MKTITNKFKIALAAVGLLAMGTVSGQTTQGAGNTIVKQTGVDYGTTETGSIKVIDNKGTIKYLQANNGITTFTNTTGSVTTTTWQLGGALTEDTYIDATGKVFALDGIQLVDTTTENPATTATVADLHGTTGSGYTLLVRDEATGATKKLLMTDLVESIQTEVEVTAANIATVKTITLSFTTNINKLLIFRNGAKLRAGTDYTLDAAGTTATLVEDTADSDSRNYWKIFEGDIIEYQYSK